MNSYRCIADDVKLGKDVRLSQFINLYGCSVGDESKIGAFVEIQKNATVGRRCKISSHSFVCEGVEIEDNVFIGHGVKFVNDTYPRATTAEGGLQTEADWKVERTVVRKGASIGTGATILSKLTIGENAIVGAGSVVTHDVPPYAIVAGNPARVLRYIEQKTMTNEPVPVPFLDLVAPHRELENELVEVFRHGLHTAGFVGGSTVESFEKDFAAFCEASHAIAVNSGTDALRFALIAAGIGEGDVVVTVPNTFIATTEAISQSGAVPEFVDVDEQTASMSVERLREYLETLCSHDAAGRLVSQRSGKFVKGIIPVHLYGQTADMDPILELAEKYGLIVIEDACQAHGAEYFSKKLNRWRKAGSMGHAAAFSFYPGKNLGACGEGGAITTNDEALAKAARQLRDHGQAKKYYHDIEGYNGRLDAIQAGLLHVKLPHLSGWNLQRRAHAEEYNKRFAGNKHLKFFPEPEWARSVYHLYVVRTADREGLAEHLHKAGIGSGIHYPIPLHLQKAYASMHYGPGSFPVTEKLAAEILSLPMFPQMTAAQQTRVIEEVEAFAAKASPAVAG
ncbi:MAG: DegT/DnrJ/EryC1/StrS family aminotransferase [Terracidiphilus sp.]|nr:DegT/DnrJ/EryC1/StrS family aminotransferase [Terracidiphilus sp.]